MNLPGIPEAATKVTRAELLWLAALGVVVLFVQLRGFVFAGTGLDPSWMRVLEHAALYDWRWGHDIVFTFGPLGYLSPALFHVETAAAVLIWQLVLAAGWIIFFSAFSSGRSVLLAMLALPAILVGLDHLTLALPFAGAVLAMSGHYRRSLLLFLLAGLAANVKFSSLIAAVALAGITDIQHLPQVLRFRQVPVSLVALLGFLAGYLLGGQALADLPAFLSTSVAVAGGYGDAMATTGSTLDLWQFLVLAVTAGVIALVVAGRDRRVSLLLIWGLMVFLLFKFGYVRHSAPRHAHAMAGLSALAMLLFVGVCRAPRQRWATPVMAMVVLTCVVMTVMALPGPTDAASRLQATAKLFQARGNTITDLLRPSRWEALAVRRERTDTYVAEGWSLPSDVTVDALGWSAGTALMSGAMYKPRPVFQSYAAYSPPLVRLNLEAWRRQPPQRVLFQATGIDGWWPGLADGELHTELQQNYRVLETNGTVLHLERDPISDCGDTTVDTQTFAAGEWVELAAANRNAVRYLRLELPRSVSAAIRKTLYKGRIPLLEARLDDGSVVQRKFPRGFSGQWFPISPVISRGNERLLFQPGLAPSSARVRAFRVLQDNGSVEGLTGLLRWQQLDRICKFQDDDWITSLTSSAIYDHPLGPKFESGALSAHAPMLFQLPVQSLSSVRLTFGIRDGAWKQGKTDGVRFDLVFQSLNGLERMLATRTLKPRQRAADRKDQEMIANLIVPESGTLMIGILPLENTGWDWSYIRNLEMAFGSPPEAGTP